MSRRTGRRVNPLLRVMLDKADADMRIRLNADGTPRTPGNDYERHLFARYLYLQGKTQEEVRAALVGLGLEDVSPHKKESYIEDILRSVLVGYSDDPLPIYVEVK